MKKLILGCLLLLLASPKNSPALNDFSQYTDMDVSYFAYYSPSIPTKVAAIKTLGMRGYTSAIPYLVELCYDSNREIRTASIKALGMMRAQEALDTYYFIIWDQSGSFTTWDKQSAVWAMSKYPDINIYSLIDVLDLHPDFKVALEAAKCLSKRPEYQAQLAISLWKPLLDSLE